MAMIHFFLERFALTVIKTIFGLFTLSHDFS